MTIWTGDEKGGGSSNLASDQPGLADPNRPVWILESGFPKLASTPDEGVADLDTAPTGGGGTWPRRTPSPSGRSTARQQGHRLARHPVQAGTYTLHYELSAGLNGKAKAVAEDGSPVGGEFVVTITDKPARATVGPGGDVEIENP